MTAPNTGAPNASAPNNANAATAQATGTPSSGAAARALSDAERESLPAHAGGFSVSNRMAALESKYDGKIEGTHSLDRSVFTAALVLKDGTRIAAQGASMADAVAALTTRFDKIGGAFTNA